MPCGVLFLLIKSTADPTSAMMIAKVIAPTVPKLANASTELVCVFDGVGGRVAEDEPDVMEVGRMLGVGVVLERFVVLLGLTVLLSRKTVTGVNWSWTPLGRVTKFGALPWANTCSA